MIPGVVSVLPLSTTTIFHLAEGGSIITSVAFLPDGRFLASAGRSEEESIKLWDVASGRERRVVPTKSVSDTPWSSVDFSPDGSVLATRTYNYLTLWDAARLLETSK